MIDLYDLWFRRKPESHRRTWGDFGWDAVLWATMAGIAVDLILIVAVVVRHGWGR